MRNKEIVPNKSLAAWGKIYKHRLLLAKEVPQNNLLKIRADARRANAIKIHRLSPMYFNRLFAPTKKIAEKLTPFN